MFLRPFHRLSVLAAAGSAVFLLAPTAPARAQTFISAPFDNLGTQTLVPNGDFENGLTGWSIFNSMVTFTTSNVNPLVGVSSVRGTITTPFSGAGSALFQTVSGLTPGATYVLSAFFNTSNLNPLADAYIDLGDIAGEPQVGLPGGVIATQFGFATFIAPGNSVTVRFVVDATGATVPAGSFATADNIAVTPLASFVPVNAAASAAPEPGTLALLGLTGLPLGGMMIRRRHAS
jgi:hypothetical protein